MRVDVHAHLFPAAYLDALEAAGARGLAFIRGLGAGDEPAEVDRRLEAMDAAGIDLQILSPSSLLPALDSPERSAAAATLLNDRIGAVIRRHPGRFGAFAVVPLPHLEVALAALDDALARPDTAGIAVATSIGGVSIADVRFEPLFAELDRRASTLFIHPAGDAAGSARIEDLGLSWTLGAFVEDTVSVTHLISRGIPARYPNLRLVSAHLGGGLSMLLRRIDDQLPRISSGVVEPASAAVGRMWFDTVSGGHPPALAAARLALGAERLVLGTDYPFVSGDGLRRAIGAVAAGFEAAEAEAIFGRGASFLPAPGRG